MAKTKTRVHILIVILLSILLFFLTTSVASSLLLSATLRHYAEENTVGTMVEEALNNDDVTQTIAEMICDEFINDERITTDNVQALLADGTFQDFIAEVEVSLNGYLLGSDDISLTTEDIISLLDENEDLIYDTIGLRFLEEDREILTEQLDTLFEGGTLSSYLSTSGLNYLSSLWLMVIDGIFLLLFLLALLSTYRQRKLGIAVILYAVAGIIAVAFDLLMLISLQSLILEYIDESLQYILTPLVTDGIYPAMIGGIVSLAILGIGILMCALQKTKKVVLSTEEPLPEYDHQDSMPSAPHVTLVDTSPAPIPEEELPENSERHYCRHCGQLLVNDNAKFCYKCGTPQ